MLVGQFLATDPGSILSLNIKVTVFPFKQRSNNQTLKEHPPHTQRVLLCQLWERPLSLYTPDQKVAGSDPVASDCFAPQTLNLKWPTQPSQS